MEKLLKVENLKTHFHTPEGTVHAVNGVSFHIDEGETLAVVGESGCGKTVSMLSILGLIPIPPGEIVSGSAYFNNRDLLLLSEEELETIRGREISMIFQDPMTSLNPVLTIGYQLTEALRLHLGYEQDEAAQRAVEQQCRAGGSSGRTAGQKARSSVAERPANRVTHDPSSPGPVLARTSVDR